jgi:hypothetical protein
VDTFFFSRQKKLFIGDKEVIKNKKVTDNQ